MEASPARLDEQARRTIEAAYEAHHAGLVRRLAIVVGDPYEAQDLAQATFERARSYGRIAHDALAIFPDSIEKKAMQDVIAFCVARAH